MTVATAIAVTTTGSRRVAAAWPRWWPAGPRTSVADSLAFGGGRPRAAATAVLLTCLLAPALAGCGASRHQAADVRPGPAQATPSLSAPPSPAASVSPRAVAPLYRSAPVRIVITRLGLNAPLVPVGQTADGTVATPPFSQPRTAGWYTGSVTPGQNGTSVIVGHVDTPTGPAVFYPLTVARAGDTVAITRADRSTADFTVDAIKVIPRDDFDENTVYGPTGRPEVRLITCGGTFDKAMGEYTSNVVVYAHLTGAQT
ncbi:class F sortase [Streptacidiphilus pinicola]|uniref:class F sortase n=1 Tax=Streptacidiphilus pinicola TaxID=2219663 RepID=UPI00311E87CC